MTDIIEQDAIASTPGDPPPLEGHTHEVKSFVATPRFDQSLMERMVTWFKGGNLNAPIVYKTASGLRRMLLFTSNSYMDREKETITSKALEDYEASCYPGEDLYHNDNPMLWWHDDDVPMGTIEGVEYIVPFLIEVGQELPSDPISKALWDFAEANGDKAAVSHRFAYLEKDRDEDGTFHHIIKQETSYLPERSLAANGKTYAGVLSPMSIPESRKRLGQILAATTGVEDIEEVLHNEGVPAARKRLAEMGVNHKAAKPPFPPKDPTAPAIVETDAVQDDVIEEDVEEEKGEDLISEGGTIDLKRFMILMDGVMGMLGNLITEQADMELDRVGMMKAFDELKEARVSEKAAEKATLETLEAKLKSLEDRLAKTEKQMNLVPRSAQNEKGMTQQELETSTNALANTLKNIGKGEVKTHPIFGVPYDPSKIPTYDKE